MAALESITAEAARLLGVPVAWAGMLSRDGEEIVAATGTQTRHIPTEISFAARIRGAKDVVVIEDASRDGRVSGHPIVAGAPHVRFIAAAPFFDGAAHYLGALVAVGTEAKSVAPEKVGMLRLLARMIEFQLSVRDEIVEEQERFRDFFEQTRDLLLSIAPDGTILHANETATMVLGIERGSALAQLVDADRREEFVAVLENVFTRGMPERVETIFTGSDRRRVILEGWLMPKIVAGAPVFARVVFRDVTDRKEFETELANARDAALEAARTKTAFLTNVSHEIRTPMNGIIGMIDLLLASRLDAEQQDFAHQARSSAEGLLSIVSNILYISSLEAGSLTATRVAFDLQRSMDRIIEVMKIAALGKDVGVHFVYDASLPQIVRGNQSKIRQIVTNLLDNAIKFTEQGEVVLRIALQTETDTHRVVRFEVRDTGIGIPEEARLLLFERFAQLDGGATRAYSGAGLGLATAQRLVETMGGLIDVDSTPGKGSTFWFTVPFRKEEPGHRLIASSDFELKGKRALLFDRQPDSRRLAMHYLTTTWEMRADAVASAAELQSAVRHAADAEDPYKLIIFEAAPDLDPPELARMLREDPRTAAAGLVVMVSPNALIDEASLREKGIDAWTHKPIGQRELFDAIAIALAHEAIAMPRVERAAAPAPLPPGVVEAPLQAVADAGEPIKILLVEDNFLNMKLTVSQLRKLGHDPDTVVNGSEALAAIRRRRYDVILMDCQMPVMDGYEATGEIRRLERAGAPRHWIVAMTANALEGDRERCLAAGMDDYLSKPTHQTELEHALNRRMVPRPLAVT